MTPAMATKRTAHDKANLRCAHIIADDPAKYSGLMQVWAQRILERELKKI